MKLDDFSIKFSGLALGEHSFDFQLNNEFFSFFDFDDFNASDLNVQVDLLKKSNGLDIDIQISGTVEVPCDISSEPYDQEIESETRLLVKFADEYDDSQLDILVLKYGEHAVSLAQYFYEMSVLAVPLKRVSPSSKEKQIIEKSESAESTSVEEKEITDPRWDKLKNLLN